MADHFVKISEVPKEKRLQYFWDYYKVHTIVAIILVICVISIIKTTVFRTKEDSYILIAGQTSPVTSDVKINVQNYLANGEFDLNGDGKSFHNVEFVMLKSSESQKQSTMDAEVESVNLTKLTALFTTGNYVLQIVDETMAEVLIQEGLVAKTDSFEGKNYPEENGFVKIPVSDTKLKEAFGVSADKYFIIPRGRDGMSAGNDKKIKNYENSIKILDGLLK